MPQTIRPKSKRLPSRVATLYASVYPLTLKTCTYGPFFHARHGLVSALIGLPKRNRHREHLREATLEILRVCRLHQR
jgi:hypothetical protein